VGIHGWIWLGCTLLARTTALNNVKLNTSPNFFDDDPDSLQNKLNMHEAVREKSKTLPKSYCTLPVSGQCAMKNGPSCSQGIPSSWPVCLQVSLKLLLQGASTADSTPPYQLAIYISGYIWLYIHVVFSTSQWSVWVFHGFSLHALSSLSLMLN
jgi:hypothetical protein